jgi:hypothetical protein
VVTIKDGVSLCLIFCWMRVWTFAETDCARSIVVAL